MPTRTSAAIRDATRRPRRRVSRRQLSRDGVVGFTTPRRFHHPAHLPVRHEKGDEFERAEKIGGFLRCERGSPRGRRRNLRRDNLRECVEERTLAEKGLIGGRTAEEVVAQLETVLHDDAPVRGPLFADDVEAPFERALERDELSQIFVAAGEPGEQQKRLVANHLAFQHHVHQSPHAHRVTHDGLAQVMRVRGAQRGEKLHGVISHVKIALVEKREDELDVRGDARANASALTAPGPAPSSEGFEPSTPSSPTGLCSDPAVMAFVSTSRTRWTNSASSRSSRRDSTRVGMPMAPIANCAARDSKTRSRSSAAAERRSVASTPSLMRSRRGCGAAGRWAGARGFVSAFPSGRGCRRRRASRGGERGRDLEGRGKETAADRFAHLSAAVIKLAVVLAVAEDDGAGDVAHGASHALRVPGPGKRFRSDRFGDAGYTRARARGASRAGGGRGRGGGTRAYPRNFS